MGREQKEVVVVSYNAGNVKSMQFALERLGAVVTLTDNPDTIRKAPRVIFPGVGDASYAMEQVEQRGLTSVLTTLKQPFLGVCVGMQLMCESSEEGDTKGLGIFESQVKLFPKGVEKVPHVGWNHVVEGKSQKSPLLRGIPKEGCFYFVHSYYATLCTDTLAQTEHILPFSSILQRNNYYGVQFHPEKSGPLGAKLLENFLALA